MLARRDLLTSALCFGVLPSLARAQDAETPEATTIEIPDMAIGDPEAAVTVIEYASFTCPHCADFHEDVFGELKANYIDTGKIYFVFREVYFDRYGLWASAIARCGGEMRFFGLADRILSTQREWTAGGEPAAIADNLRRIGLTAGLSSEQIEACLNDGAQLQALVDWYSSNATADNITGTPTFRINGETYSNMRYEKFAEILDEKLAG